jgi:putative ABC transport system permease protein
VSPAIALARRELRAGVSGFRLFLACLALGVAAIAGVGSFSRAVTDGLTTEARAMLGGDISLRSAHQPIGAAARDWLARQGTLSGAVAFRSMARRGEFRTLVEVKAVDDAYPLYGAIVVEPAQDIQAALAERNNTWGAVADQTMMERIGAKIGDRIEVGDATYEVRARIRREPDLSGGTSGFPLGPRLMVSTASLKATGLLQPGSLVYYHERLRLPQGASPDEFLTRIDAEFPRATWTKRTPDAASPEVRRLVDRTLQFLALIALTTLLVGGVGIGNAVRGHLQSKTATIATLKCLGASGALVFATYLLQVLAMAALAIVIGVALGGALPFAIVAILGDALPIDLNLGLAPEPLALAALFGLIATIAFSLWPIARACRVAPAALFRDTVAPSGKRPGSLAMIAVAASAALLAALAIAASTDRPLAMWFVLAAVVALLTFGAAGWIVRRLAALARPRRLASLRLALANLHRPGTPTGSVVLSLGLGLTVLVAIALVEGNLARLAEDTIPARAPGYFFIDIPNDDVAGFEATVKAAAPDVTLERVPMLRGRVVKINGVRVSDETIGQGGRWMVSSDRGVSWSATPPDDPIVAGTWWPKDYAGEPLVSLDAGAARGLGVQLGDTITVDILGREVTGRIATLRRVDWRSLGINFAIIFSPNALAGAPATHIASLRGSPTEEDAAERAIAKRFPAVTSIRVRDVVAQVEETVGKVADAVRAAAAVTLVAGGLVLAGAVAAGHRRRVYDAVILKAMGATRGDIARAFLYEHFVLGLAAAGVAAALGTVAAELLVSRIMHIDWSFLPAPVAVTALGATAFCLAVGFLGTWRALGQKAAPWLRNE